MTTICNVARCPRDAIRRTGRGADRKGPKERPGSTWEWRKQRARAIQRDHGICWESPGADSEDRVVRDRDGGGIELNNVRAAHLLSNLRRG
jgi:hypothetical protein